MPSSINNDDARFYIVLAAGALLRLALFAYEPLVKHASLRLELATPVTSWKSLQEGLYLFRSGLDPYDGSIYKQAPLLLPVFDLLGDAGVPFLYTLADLGTAYGIASIARFKATARPARDKGCLDAHWVALLTLFNPLGLLSTLSRSTTCLSNFLIATALSQAASGNTAISICFLSLALHLSMPVILLPALVLILSQTNQISYANMLKRTLPLLAAHQSILLTVSYFLTGSWTFLRTYSAMVTVQDLTPNIGLYWYIFIEMFEHFRDFFLLVFQAHLVCYAVPICLKLQFDPLLAFTVLTGIQATFKSYPTLGDMALYHSLLALFPELVPHMRHPMFTIMAHLYTLLLLPTFHHLWLYAGSGNSNFYYASTLVWALASGLGILDTITAGLKRRFLLEQSDKGHPALKSNWEKPSEEDWSVVQQ